MNNILRLLLLYYCYYHLCFLPESQCRAISTFFSPGDFKELAPRDSQKKEPNVKTTEDREEGDQSVDQNQQQLFMCPKEGCTRGFQRHSALEKHIMFGKCTQTIERETLLDRAKLKYAERLCQGETSMPKLPSTSSTEGEAILPEGWALKQAKKAYRFNEEQRRYLEARFNIGQESGMKIDADVVAKEMRRARGSNGEWLFRVSEFLTAQQVASFFSQMAAKIKQQSLKGSDAPTSQSQSQILLPCSMNITFLQLEKR